MKHYRLWIDAKGEPLYVEIVDGEAVSPESFQGIAATIKEGFLHHKPIILGPDWEIRMVSA
jgi:hypothetical protein